MPTGGLPLESANSEQESVNSTDDSTDYSTNDSTDDPPRMGVWVWALT